MIINNELLRFANCFANYIQPISMPKIKKYKNTFERNRARANTKNK